MAANIAVLTQLRERWQDSVDMITSMFDLVIVPSGARWPVQGDGVFIRMDRDRRSGEPAVRVALYRSTSRASLTKPGGTALVAGDICKTATAPAVVEAFLYQIARPAGTVRLTRCEGQGYGRFQQRWLPGARDSVSTCPSVKARRVARPALW
jgi:hypothetical protein